MEDKYLIRKQFEINSNIFDLSTLSNKERNKIKKDIIDKIHQNINSKKEIQDFDNVIIPVFTDKFNPDPYLFSLDREIRQHLSSLEPPLNRLFLASLGIISTGLTGYTSSKNINSEILSEDLKKKLNFDNSITSLLFEKDVKYIYEQNDIIYRKKIDTSQKLIERRHKLYDQLAVNLPYRRRETNNSTSIQTLTGLNQKNTVDFNAVSVLNLKFSFVEFLYYISSLFSSLNNTALYGMDFFDTSWMTLFKSCPKEVKLIFEKIKHKDLKNIVLYLDYYYKEYSSRFRRNFKKDLNLEDVKTYEFINKNINFSLVFFIKDINEYIRKKENITGSFKINSNYCICNPLGIKFGNYVSSCFVEDIQREVINNKPFVLNVVNNNSVIKSKYSINYFLNNSILNKYTLNNYLKNVVFSETKAPYGIHEFEITSTEPKDITISSVKDNMFFLNGFLYEIILLADSRLRNSNKSLQTVLDILYNTVSNKDKSLKLYIELLNSFDMSIDTFKEVLIKLINKLNEIKSEINNSTFSDQTIKMILSLIITGRYYNIVRFKAMNFNSGRYSESQKKYNKIVYKLTHKFNEENLLKLLKNFQNNFGLNLLSEEKLFTHPYLVFKNIEFKNSFEISNYFCLLNESYNEKVKELANLVLTPLINEQVNLFKKTEGTVHYIRIRRFLDAILTSHLNQMKRNIKQRILSKKEHEFYIEIGELIAVKNIIKEFILPSFSHTMLSLKGMQSIKGQNSYLDKEKFIKYFTVSM